MGASYTLAPCSLRGVCLLIYLIPTKPCVVDTVAIATSQMRTQRIRGQVACLGPCNQKTLSQALNQVCVMPRPGLVPTVEPTLQPPKPCSWLPGKVFSVLSRSDLGEMQTYQGQHNTMRKNKPPSLSNLACPRANLGFPEIGCVTFGKLFNLSLS